MVVPQSCLKSVRLPVFAPPYVAQWLRGQAMTQAVALTEYLIGDFESQEHIEPLTNKAIPP